MTWMMLGVVDSVGFEPTMFHVPNTKQLAKYKIYIQRFNASFSPCGAVVMSVNC